MVSIRRQILVLALGGICLSPALVLAQASYPSKPVTVVVSYPPGGDTDAIARLFAEKLGQLLISTQK